MSQVFKSLEAGQGPRRPTRANSLRLICLRAARDVSRPFRADSSRRRSRRLVSWLTVSLADRDLFFQDSHIFSGRGYAPASMSRASRPPSAVSRLVRTAGLAGAGALALASCRQVLGIEERKLKTVTEDA